ncbi:helix-turn-helix domain-containing protein [Weissella minor]|nr:helix-turn-helix transcriptional regulator [Weissella minor]
MTLLDRIKEISKKRGLSVKEVSKRAGFGERTIYRWDTNNPSTEKIKAVADVLGVSVDYLLGNADEMHTKQADTSKPIEVNLDEALQDKGMVMKFNGKDLSDTAKRGILNILEMLEEDKHDSK